MAQANRATSATRLAQPMAPVEACLEGRLTTSDRVEIQRQGVRRATSALYIPCQTSPANLGAALYISRCPAPNVAIVTRVSPPCMTIPVTSIR